MKNIPYLGLTHEQFVKRLKESQKAVYFLRDYIEAKGFKTYVPELRIAPNQEVRADYSDEIDLIFYRKNGDEVRVEVKQLSNYFNETNWKYNSIIVNSITGYNSKEIKPDVHVCLSKCREFAAVIDNSNLDKWYLKTVYDRVKKRDLKFYFLNKKYVKFVKL